MERLSFESIILVFLPDCISDLVTCIELYSTSFHRQLNIVGLPALVRLLCFSVLTVQFHLLTKIAKIHYCCMRKVSRVEKYRV